ncbi:hypothetical protein [Ligilactobacillus salivarius]|uniref:Uncharacterized protein n=1 Tax=Ligilactobacillus salivarius TaxID=1624 RepID=A0A2U2M8T5_9LACO|nr:hypothetical protein [Ligilactobacillus salivarius]PWG53230.1 hypothetical protein DB362_04730 [Ligilactobacillus salivarius]
MFGYSDLREELDLNDVRDFLYHHGLEKNTKIAALKRMVKEYAEYLKRLSDEEINKLDRDSNILLETKLDINAEDFKYLTEIVQTIAQSAPMKVNVEEKNFSSSKFYYVYEIVPGYYLAKLTDLDKYYLSQNMSLENLKLTNILDKAEIFKDEEEIIDLDLDGGKIKKVFSVLEPHFHEVSGKEVDSSDYEYENDISPNKLIVTPDSSEVDNSDDEFINELNGIHIGTQEKTVETNDNTQEQNNEEEPDNQLETDDEEGEVIDDLDEDEANEELEVKGGLFFEAEIDDELPF